MGHIVHKLLFPLILTAPFMMAGCQDASNAPPEVEARVNAAPVLEKAEAQLGKSVEWKYDTEVDGHTGQKTRLRKMASKEAKAMDSTTKGKLVSLGYVDAPDVFFELEAPVPERRASPKNAPSGLRAGVIGAVGGAGGRGSPSAGSGGGGMASGRGMGSAVYAKKSAAYISPRVAVAPKPADKNAWYQNTYQAGMGDRDSLAKSIEAGVLVGEERIHLASFNGSYAQDYPLPSSGALGLTLRTDRAQPGPDGGSIFLEVGLQASAKEMGDRPPLDIVLVIDTSGSMESEGKIEAVRSAAREVINRLGEDDHLGIVTYSNDAHLLSPLGPVLDAKNLTRLVLAISADGGTNIHGGLTLGYEQVEDSGRDAATPLVLLLSDGKVTSGIRDPLAFKSLSKAASDKDIVTTSIGMGVSYDESLMMAISRAGGGNYHFIKDSAAVATVIETEINELSEALARAVRMRIVLPEGVELVRVLGTEALSKKETAAVKAAETKLDEKLAEEMGIKTDRQKQDEDGIKMLIPAFKANDNHLVLLELKVERGSGDLELAEVHIKYKDMRARKNVHLEEALTLHYAKDKKASVASIDRRVKKNIMGFMTGESLMKAGTSLASNDVTSAVRTIDDHMTLLGAAAKQWHDSDLEADAKLLGEYKAVLTTYAQQGRSRELVSYLSKSLSYSAYQRLN